MWSFTQGKQHITAGYHYRSGLEIAIAEEDAHFVNQEGQRRRDVPRVD
jgi:hypothetical protein